MRSSTRRDDGANRIIGLDETFSNPSASAACGGIFFSRAMARSLHLVLPLRITMSIEKMNVQGTVTGRVSSKERHESNTPKSGKLPHGTVTGRISSSERHESNTPKKGT